METVKTFDCTNCGHSFLEDGDKMIGSFGCPSCNSSNVGARIKRRVLSASSTDSEYADDQFLGSARIIAKYYEGPKKFAPIYMMGDKPQQCMHAGLIANEAMDVLIETGVMIELPSDHVIDKYSGHQGFSTDSKRVRYYEIKQR